MSIAITLHVLCTRDGDGAAVSWEVVGGSACGIAVQTLNVLQVGWPPRPPPTPPLCQIEGMLSSPTSASGLPADILKSVHVMLQNLPVLPVRQLVEFLHLEGLHPVTA